MMRTALSGVEFDLAREEGDGAIVSVDLHGLFDLDEVEQIFDALVRDGEIEDEFGVGFIPMPGEERDPDELVGGALLVEHLYRIEVPAEDPDSDGDWTAWDYLTADDGMGRTDGVMVTRLERRCGWLDRMCWAHPFEPATSGLPVVQHPDYERWARGEYLWCCGECAAQLSAEQRVWSAQRMQQFDLLRARGLRDTFSKRGVVPAGA